MTGDRHSALANTLESLKQAVALLEQSAAQQTAGMNAALSAEEAEAMRLADSLLRIRAALRDALTTQPALGAALQQLARWLNELAMVSEFAATQPVPAQSVPAPGPEQALPAPPGSAPAAPAPIPVQQVPLMIGNAATMLHVPGTAAEAQSARVAAERTGGDGWSASPGAPLQAPPAPVDMKLIAERCRLKAEGCEWAAQYRDQWQDALEDGGVRKVRYDDIIARARALPNCYVWALNPRLSVPGFRKMSDFASGYRNLAAAAELADSLHRDGPRGGDWLLEGYSLLAEAQSALRAATDTEGFFTDTDQDEAFRWLRTRTTDDRVLVPRYMRLDDPADIAQADDLASRLGQFRMRLDALRRQNSDRRAFINKARYHSRLLAERKSSDETGDWRKLIEALDAAIAGGAQPSDIDIRDVLAAVIDIMPEGMELPQGFTRVMEALDQYLTTREMNEAQEPRPRPPSPELLEAAELLRDKTVILIGGEVRPRSKAALERELNLAELRWISAAHHQSHYLFESAIARPEPLLVLLAIRWSSHSFENVDELCQKYGKLYVRLPGGYNPNQVAKQVLDQVGDQLRELSAPRAGAALARAGR